MPTKVKVRSAAAAVAGKNGHSLISDAKFRQLYATMLKYKLLEEHLGSGSESNIAGAVGVALDLKREDTVVLTPHNFLTNFVKGVPLQAMLKHQHANGTVRGVAFNYSAVSVLTSASSSMSAQLGFATGAALTNKLAKNQKIAVAFVEGDANALIGCKEALELAASQKLPILYVLDKRAGDRHGEILSKLDEMFPVIAVDAHDVVAVYRVAQESIARVREGGGPALIACAPFPVNGSPVNAVENMERYLLGKKLSQDRWKNEAIAEFRNEMDEALSARS